MKAQRSHARRESTFGFTLIELLVVLVVLGIAAGIIVLNLSGDDRRDIQREAKRLAGALEHAAAVAQWSGETLGVSAEGRAYRFWRRDANDQWAAFTSDEVLAARALPAGLIVMPTSYAGAPVPPDAILPFRASGRNEPYALTLVSPAGSVIVSADPLNRVAFAPLTPSIEERAMPVSMPPPSPDRPNPVPAPPRRDGPDPKREPAESKPPRGR